MLADAQRVAALTSQWPAREQFIVGFYSTYLPKRLAEGQTGLAERLPPANSPGAGIALLGYRFIVLNRAERARLVLPVYHIIGTKAASPKRRCFASL